MSDTIFWRRIDLPGHEVGRLRRWNDGWELSGTSVFSYKRHPCNLDYVVIIDSDWRTNSAQIGGMVGEREINLRVTVDSEQNWFLNDAECPAVAGCIDIDLSFSPSTNLLPIRRLSLDRGQEAEVKSAWLQFPSFEFQLLQQIYRRAGDSTYEYESGGGVFTRTLEVNTAGFVTIYPGLWVQEDDSIISEQNNMEVD
jgi:uncharacterized protein